MDAIEINTGEDPSWAVIFLHGLGADGHDFAPLPGELNLPVPVRFILPHAPISPVTINGGFAMPAWYDIVSLERDGPEDIAGIKTSARRLQRLISREEERGIPSTRVFVGGFSQGGSVALYTAPRCPEPLAGVIALSTWLPQSSTLAAENTPANRTVPIFMAHGTADPTIPLVYGSLSRDRLQAHGYEVQWHTYPMEHAVCGREFADISDWLTPRLLASF